MKRHHGCVGKRETVLHVQFENLVFGSGVTAVCLQHDVDWRDWRETAREPGDGWARVTYVRDAR